MRSTIIAISAFFCAGLPACSATDVRPPPESVGESSSELCVFGNRARVSISGGQLAATVSPRFLSVAVDSAQVVGFEFWNPDGDGNIPVEPYDFGRLRLRRLASELAPAYLRIGGTDADRVFYDLGEPPLTVAPPGYQHVLTKGQWDGVANFASSLDFQILFTLNAGPGPRDADLHWQADNARQLMEYSVNHGYPVAVWELGNEVNLFWQKHGLLLTGADYARDMSTLRAVRDEVTPGALLAGPSSAYWPIIGEIPWWVYGSFLQASTERPVDIVTWHFYPQQSFRCPGTRPAQSGTMMDWFNLGAVDRWADGVESTRDEFAKAAPIWMGETSNAQCGGQPGISNRFESGFWWVDQLGRLARRGQPVVVRQALSGASYSLLEEPSLAPNPDYFTSVLWKRLMGNRVLGVDVAWWSSLFVLTYAHCAAVGAPGYRAGAVTLAFVNLDRSQAATVTLDGIAGTSAYQYTLTAPSLDSPRVLLNDVALEVGEDGSLPPLLPRVVTWGGARTLELPPASYGFVVVPDADAAACR